MRYNASERIRIATGKQARQEARGVWAGEQRRARQTSRGRITTPGLFHR